MMIIKTTYMLLLVTLCIAVQAFAESVPLELTFLSSPAALSIDVSNYTELASIVANQEDLETGNVSDDLADYCKAGDLKHLNDIAAVCRSILLDSFSPYYESKRFLFDTNEQLLQNDVDKLALSLSEIFPLYIDLLEYYYIFIDRYRGGDWFARFEQNGVYQRVKLLREESCILKAAWIVCVQNSDDNTAYSLSFSPEQVSSDLIDLYLETNQTVYLLWWYKLNSRSGTLDDPTRRYEQMISSLDQEEISYIDSIELLLLKNQVYLENEVIDFRKCLDNIYSVRVKLEEAGSLAKENDMLLFRLALFESYLCFNHLAGAVYQKEDRNLILIGSGCYDELMRIASEFPALTERIYNYITCNSQYLLEKIELDKWPESLKRWNLIIIYQIALHYRKDGDSLEYDKILNLFKAIQLSGDKSNAVYVDMLCARGGCYLEQAEGYSSVSQTVDCYKKAIQDFVEVLTLKDKLAFSTQQGQDVLHGLVFAVQRYYEKGQNKQWLLDTLGPAVDEIVDAKSIAIGSSSVDELNILCYFYSLALEDIKEFSLAMHYFSQVTTGELKRAANFHKLYCKYQVINKSGNKDKLYSEVIMPLESLLFASDDYDSIAVSAAVILSEACFADNRLDVYLKAVPQVLASVDKAQAVELVKFAQKYVLLCLDDEFMARAAAGDSIWYMKRLNTLKPLAADMYNKSSEEDKALSSVLYSRLIGFEISSTADRTEIKDLIDDNAAVLKDLGKYIDDNHLEKVRNQTFLDIASRDYSASRKKWFIIRSLNKSKEEYFYWEARYWGILCHIFNDDSQQAMHSIDVLLAEYDLENNEDTNSKFSTLWVDRIRKLALK